MKLYKISQQVNNGYDTFDAAIVTAENEEDARKIHPRKSWGQAAYGLYYDDIIVGEVADDTWCALKDVQVECIGITDTIKESKIILASFNAG